MAKGVWAFTDIETTGTDIVKDVMLEIAIVITDPDLKELAHKNLVIHPNVMPKMDPEVIQMHTASKLLDDVAASTLTLYGAEDEIIDFLKANVEKTDNIVLGGNNIGFDRKFVERDFKRLNTLGSFRSIDISGINELGKHWYPEILKRKPKKGFGHRALADIRESISELKFYRKEFFIKLPEKGKTLSLF
jgi:oligoribonuclease